MRTLAIAAWVAGVLVLLASVVATLLAIWGDDWRWLATALVAYLLTTVVAAVGFIASADAS